MKLDPHCRRRNCCALKVLFNSQRHHMVDHIDIAGLSSAGNLDYSETRSSATAEKQRVSCPHGVG